MNVFRGLIWCLLLAAVGAIAWEVLSTDMGFVLIRWHGKIIETTVAYGLIFWLLISVALWSLWFLLRLPFNAWQSLAKKQARLRLINGMQALHEGRYARAENLLLKAANELDIKTIALMAAYEAAVKLDEPQRAIQHYTALLQHSAVFFCPAEHSHRILRFVNLAILVHGRDYKQGPIEGNLNAQAPGEAEPAPVIHSRLTHQTFQHAPRAKAPLNWLCDTSCPNLTQPACCSAATKVGAIAGPRLPVTTLRQATRQ